MAHGVRKVNEFIVRDGRALIMTQNVAAGITQAQWDSIADGTLYINPGDGNFRYKKRGNNPKEWSCFSPDNLFKNESIGGNLIAPKAITEPKLADNSVSTRTVIDRNITDVKIALNAVKNEHIADNTLEGRAIKDNTLHGNKVTTNTLHGDKVQDGTLKGTKLVQGTISNRELGSNCVQTVNILNNAVTTSKVLDANITRSKIAPLAINNALIDDSAVDGRTLASSAVDQHHVVKDAIRRRHILNGEVTTDKLEDGSVKTAKIYDEAVTNSKIAMKTIQGNRIANNTLTLGLLEPNVQTVINNAVVHDNGTARVYGHLQVDKDIKSTSNNKTYSITGFKVYNPVFADYAEGFVVSEPVEVGDIVEIDKYSCVKKADSHSRKIVGVVSDRYGMCLDADEDELKSGAKTAIGLLGKVPVNVVGKIEAGDFIISSGDGIGIATKTFIPGAIVGKALEDKETYGLGQVLCLINPM